VPGAVAAGLWKPEAVKQIAPISHMGFVMLRISLRTAFVLGFAGVAELRIGAVLEKKIRPLLVI
jgi:hypothetical protein